MHTRKSVAAPASPQHTPPSPELYRQNRCRHQDCQQVPAEVFLAIDIAWLAGCHSDDHDPIDRRRLAQLAAPLMGIADWRFCKCYRHGTTAEHRFIYRLIDTVEANTLADAREASFRGTPHPSEIAMWGTR
jgi:hypothetical protein